MVSGCVSSFSKARMARRGPVTFRAYPRRRSARSSESANSGCGSLFMETGLVDYFPEREAPNEQPDGRENDRRTARHIEVVRASDPDYPSQESCDDAQNDLLPQITAQISRRRWRNDNQRRDEDNAQQPDAQRNGHGQH